MKRNNCEESDEEEKDGLFSFYNKKDLTFSKKIKCDYNDSENSSNSSSSGTEGSSDESTAEDEILIVGKKNPSKEESPSPPQSPPPPPEQSYLETECITSNDLKASIRNDSIIDQLRHQSSINSSLDCSVVEVDSPCTVEDLISLKVRIRGVITKYPVSKNKPLEELYQDISTKEVVDRDRVTLNYKSNSIRPYDTVNSLKLTIADIVECFIFDTSNIVDDDEDKIVVKIQEKKGTRREYKINKYGTLEKQLKEFCKDINVEFEKCCFQFDGEKFEMNSTIESLGLEHGDLIDVIPPI